MRAKVFLSLFAVLIAATALASASGASTTKRARMAHIDVSTRTAVIHYLRSMHVKSKGVVIQRGVHNYAGPSCPGEGWSCTSTSHPVVQVAKAGGTNTFTCRTSRCAVVQVSHGGRSVSAGRALAVATAHAPTTNTAKCIRTGGLTQSCSITQPGPTGNNVAIVVEDAASTGLTQTASYTAQITQRTSGTGNSNTACVSQNSLIDGSRRSGAAVNVALEAHQSISITQDSASGGNTVENSTLRGSGSCDATNPLTQSQTLTSAVDSPGSVTQNENAANSGPNVSLDIEQNQDAPFFGTASGRNTAAFNQSSNLLAIASTPAGPVSQTQSSVTGGITATINQDSRGVSTAAAKQTERQCEDAVTSGSPSCSAADPPTYTLTQTQYGPVHKGAGVSAQTGNSSDVFTIDQSSTQNNDTGSGQTNVVEGDCVTAGNCTVNQTTNVDGTTTTNSQSGQAVATQTTCSGSTCTSAPPTTGTLTELPNGLSVANADVAEFGYGGMRGIGTGSIAVSGISGPVLHAFLYWHGPTNSTNSDSNASVSFNGTPVTGTNIGTASDNNWGFQNSQSYRADVTGLVTGNQSYSLNGFVKPGVADINGVALVVFYDDGNPANDRNVVLWNGNDSNVTLGPSYTSDPWDEMLSNVLYPGSGSASLDLIVSDGQTFPDDALLVNGQTLAPAGPIFQGDSTPAGSGGPSNGSLWDVKSFDITSLLHSGSNSLDVTSGAFTDNDYLSLVVAIANVPASAQQIIG
jgi:hypothetical protein